MLGSIEWSTGVEDAWSKVAQGVPRLVYFLAVLIVGMIVARVLGRATKRTLDRVGAPRFAERVRIQPHLARAGFTLSTLGGRAVRLFITLVTITTAFAVFGPGNPVSRFLDDLVAYVPNVFVAAAILAITAAAARFVNGAMHKSMAVSSGATGASMPSFLPRLATIAVWVVGSFAALDQLEVAPMVVQGVFYGALAAIVGVVIVAVGGGGISAMRTQWTRVLPADGPALDLRPAAPEPAAHAVNEF